MKTRAQTADLLKGIAVLLMIQVHIIELFASEAIYNSSIGKILLFLGGPPVAPLFMVIFGYFIAASNKTAGQLLVRGLKILALGLCLNVALNFNLIIKVNNGLLNIDILPYIFGVDILQLAGISIIVITLFKRIFEKSLLLVLLAIFTVIFLGNWLSSFPPETKFLQYVFSYFYRCSDWSYFPLFPWVAYPLSGIALYALKKQIESKNLNVSPVRIFQADESRQLLKRIVIGLAFFFYLFFTVRYAIFIASDLPLYYHNDLVFAVWTLVFLAFYGYFMNEINRFAGEFVLFRYIKWLGKNVTIIYVLQWILIGNTATEIYKTVSSPPYLLAYFAAALAIASGVCYSLLFLKEKLVYKAA